MAVPRRSSRPGTRSRRPARAPRGGKSGNTGLIVGGIVGGLLLIIILAVALSGSDGSGNTRRSPSGSGVDISGLERAGIAKCEEGLRVIQQCRPLLNKASLSGSEKSTLKSDLTRGNNLIEEGITKLDKAYELTKGEAKFQDTKKYLEARIYARKKLLEMK